MADAEGRERLAPVRAGAIVTRAARRRCPVRLQVFDVETYDVHADDWTPAGSVLLYHDAPGSVVEHALVALGIYMPRGNDTLDWGDFGVIREYGETPAVRLMPRERDLARRKF